MRIDWKFLDTFNNVGFKGWSGGWLWINTGIVWDVCAIISTINGKAPPTEWLFAWLGGLAAYSGIGALQYKSMRETDYGALDRKAAIESAKAPSSATTTVQTGSGPVNVEGSK